MVAKVCATKNYDVRAIPLESREDQSSDVQGKEEGEEKKSDERVEEVLDAVGFGWWQAPLFCVAIFVQIVEAIHILGTTLFSAPMAFYCTLDNTSVPSNTSEYDSKCLSKGEVVGTGSQAGPPSCPVPHYDTAEFQSTTTSEWNLICEWAPLRSMFQVAFNIGEAVGTVLGGHISDSLGRRTTILMGSALSLPACLIMAFSPWYTLVLLMRFAIGVAVFLMLVPIYTLVMESCPARNRVSITISSSLTISIAIMGMGGVSMLVRDFRHLLLICLLPTVCLIPLAIVMNESPRWLVQRGRNDQAAKLLTKAARINHLKSSPVLDSFIRDLKKDTMTKTATEKMAPKTGFLQEMWHCVKSPAMRHILISASLLSFANRLLFIGMPLNAPNITKTGTQQYVVFLGVADGLAITSAFVLMRWSRRRVVTVASHLLVILLLLLDVTLSLGDVWQRWGLMMGIYLLMTLVYEVSLVYFVELMPTVVRARGVTMLDLFGCFGELCAPFITDLLVIQVWWAVDASFLVAAVVGGVASFLLPETRNLPLPDTIKDVEERHHRKRAEGLLQTTPGVPTYHATDATTTVYHTP